MSQLKDFHFTTSDCGSLQQAMATMRHDKYTAIVFIPQEMDVDALEFVLNVRDLDAGVPIVIVDKSKETRTNGVLSTFITRATTCFCTERTCVIR
ncbi:MAG: hypothetical protein ACE5OP_11535 [Candidatus Glassbacteria bacterium]